MKREGKATLIALPSVLSLSSLLPHMSLLEYDYASTSDMAVTARFSMVLFIQIGAVLIKSGGWRPVRATTRILFVPASKRAHQATGPLP